LLCFPPKVLENETLEGQIQDLRHIIDSRLDETKESGFLQPNNQKVALFFLFYLITDLFH
jgi:ABC-type amino acid transport substrate-binding protein